MFEPETFMSCLARNTPKNKTDLTYDYIRGLVDGEGTFTFSTSGDASFLILIYK